MDIGTEYLKDTAERFKVLRSTAEKAIAQVDDEAFFAAPDPETNSIAVNMKHVGGNLRSRFTGFLSSDGEKPDRDRESEFVVAGETRADVQRAWEGGWAALEDALAGLAPDDLLRTIYIRGEPHTVLGALNRAVAHVANHVGMIVLLSRHYAGDAWRTLSIPRGASQAFNAEMAAAHRGA